MAVSSAETDSKYLMI